MICPRCAVGEISDRTHECTLCGFSPAGVATLTAPFPRELEASARKDLEQEFQIEGVLGQGPRGVVYLALERERDRLVALKIIPRTAGTAPEADALLQREASLAASLDHPHIVPVYRAGATRIFLWYVMEYANGRSLAEALASDDETAPDWAQCLRIIHQVASGLDYAHRRGMTHGGVKPGNILIDSRGWARVTDFGIARAFGRPQAVFGADAPAEQRYLAPEQFASRNLAGPSVDQYGLAVVAHDCLRGAAPTPHVLEALQRATSEHPSERFATILDFVTALETETAAPVPVVTLPPPPLRRSSAGLTASGAVAAPLVVIDSEAPPPARLPRPSRGAPRRHRMGMTLVVAMLLLGGATATAWWWLQEEPAPKVMPGTFVLQPANPSPAVTPPATVGSTTVRPPATSRPLPAPTPAPVATTPVPARRPAPRRPARPAAPDGHLLLNTQPWSEVYLDGVAVGNTPKTDLPVTPGTHQLRFVRDGFRPYETTVTVAAGASLRLTSIVLSPTSP